MRRRVHARGENSCELSAFPVGDENGTPSGVRANRWIGKNEPYGSAAAWCEGDQRGESFLERRHQDLLQLAGVAGIWADKDAIAWVNRASVVGLLEGIAELD